MRSLSLTGGEAVKTRRFGADPTREGLPPVHGDRVQLQQVILNLIINAIEAMSGINEGPRELLISTGEAEPETCSSRCSDSGPGLAPTNLERLFEAFYTTKATRLGHGAVDLPFDHRGAWRSAVGHR